jgi:hypothetical protein
VTVRSTRHPDALYQYTATGVVVRDPAFIRLDEDRDRAAGELIGESGLLIQGNVAGGAG